MAYLLLTGASGLLGSYLLRDCLRAGHTMAVLVRPTKTEPAWRRVDASLARWEKQTSQCLPRPVVLDGDLCGPDLNLTASDLRWVGRHCRAMIHNAANLTFFGSDPRREPWLTNVEGTRRVLDVCRRCGIREFHYVSTAYVCGLRTGRILETELDVGQVMSNDYERSKAEAERLVHDAALPEPPTIYRPAILVGDSRTGYTSTFHGFYALVKLAHTLAGRMVPGSIRIKQLMKAFHLSGRERKNFVPVDWVSAVITYLVGRGEHHGKTYHLTARKPTPVAVWGRAIQHAVECCSPLADPADPTHADAAWFEEMLRQRVGLYRPYWRDDPQFDCAHTTAAAAHLPCPAVDHDMLLRMARLAIQADFGKRRAGRAAAPSLAHDAQDPVQRLLATEDLRGIPEPAALPMGLQMNGLGDGAAPG